MKYFPLEKYKFYFAGNKVIAVSTYAHKLVRGVAICHPEDNFDVNIGQRLAAARCNEKVAQKRYNRAKCKYFEAEQAVKDAIAHFEKMKEYKNDAYLAMNEASQSCDTIIKEITHKE